MNGIGVAVRRRADYTHIPVPKNRDGDRYFTPLRHWRRTEGTVLCVGPIHHADENVDRRRYEAARRVLPEFRIASECGTGRSDPSRLPGLLQSHRRASEHLAGR